MNTVPASVAGVESMLRRWSQFTKNLSLLPPTNERVLASADELLAGLAEVFDQGRDFVVRVSTTALEVDGVAVDVASYPVVEWLAERLVATGIAGVEFGPSLTRESLYEFTRELLENAANLTTQVLFEDLWRREHPGIRLIERRYAGANSVSSDPHAPSWTTATRRGREIADELDADPDLAERIRALEERFRNEGGTTRDLDLVGRIVNLLPAEALSDRRQLRGLVDRVIAGLSEEKSDRDVGLDALLLRVSRKYFFRDGAVDARDLGENSEQDAPTIESVLPEEVAKILEFSAPVAAEANPLPPLLDEERERAEAVGVMLSHYLYAPGETFGTAAYRQLVSALGNASPDVNTVVGRFRHRIEQRLKRTGDSEPFVRLFRLERSPSLVGRRGFHGRDLEWIRGHFPHTFLPLLDSIAAGDHHDVDLLDRLCRSVGSERLRREIAPMVEAGLLERDGRAELILSRPTTATLPLVHLLLARRESYAPQVVDFLRRIEWTAVEAAPLKILGAENLPMAYLLELTRGGADNQFAPSLRTEASKLIGRWVAATATSEAADDEKRAYAVSMLGELRSEEAWEMLERLVSDRRWFGLPRESRTIRRAAREALRRYGV